MDALKEKLLQQSLGVAFSDGEPEAAPAFARAGVFLKIP
jgi:hypothetical protein